MSAALVLEPDPRSVRRARRWVGEELEGLGRTDLVDAAELGVSELVTNAILHADPPIVLRLGGTAAHPRVEVHDTSPRKPTVHTDMAEDDKLLRTVGRGLGIVALYSTSWGAEVSADGKVVWFEPALEPAAPALDLGPDLDEPAPPGDIFDLDRTVDELVSRAEAPTELVRVRLLGMPVQEFAAFRVWYAEIRRELRLLAFSHPEDYPLATELAEISLRVEQERRHAVGVDDLDRAIVDGRTSVDLEYGVPPAAAETMRRLSDLLDEVDRFCHEQRLLTMPATPEQVALRRWYTGEFARQPAGEQPTPWPGRPGHGADAPASAAPAGSAPAGSAPAPAG
jgi:anti-sigma regulatory factor (Ser/Thr protein kinase)